MHAYIHTMGGVDCGKIPSAICKHKPNRNQKCNSYSSKRKFRLVNMCGLNLAIVAVQAINADPCVSTYFVKLFIIFIPVHLMNVSS